MAEPCIAPGGEDTMVEESQKVQQFDFVNWFYWALWWQQCSYMTSPPMFTPPAPQLTSSSPPTAATGYPGRAGGTLHPQPQGNINLLPGIGIHIRIINGYEASIAPLWKRFIAEVIDMFLFSLILKFYLTDFEYRVPEIFFENSDVWEEITDDELREIRQLVVVFMVSTVIQRITHAILETVMLFMFGWTPGKWLMGLRVMKCVQSHLTRTIPGYSVRIEPGGKLSFLQSFLRAFFKGTVSAFIPLVVFFINVPHGRTRYDKLFGSIVVDVASLHRPLFAGGQAISLNFNQGRRNAAPHVHLEVR